MTTATRTVEEWRGAMTVRAAANRLAAIVADPHSTEAEREQARADLSRSGQVQATFAKPRDPLVRLREKYVVDVSGCWLWTATVSSRGYGIVYFKGRKTQAHRVSYELHVGPIPIGKDIDHLCHVRTCINPAHLEAISHAENIQRAARRITHCPHGHSYAEHAWTRRNPKTGGEIRMCRVCRKDRDRKKRALLEEVTNESV